MQKKANRAKAESFVASSLLGEKSSLFSGRDPLPALGYSHGGGADRHEVKTVDEGLWCPRVGLYLTKRRQPQWFVRMKKKSKPLGKLATKSKSLLGASTNAPTGGGIEHVIVLMLENRSFDHLLGSLKSVYPGAGGD